MPLLRRKNVLGLQPDSVVGVDTRHVEVDFAVVRVNTVSLALGIVGHSRNDASIGLSIRVNPSGQCEPILDVERSDVSDVYKGLAVEDGGFPESARSDTQSPAFIQGECAS